MTVPSFSFLAFATIVTVAINVSTASAWRRAVLLVANAAFVLSFTREPAQLLPFGILLVIGFVSMRLMERYKHKSVFLALLTIILLMFCWLKRYSFVPNEIALGFPYFTVGMSYVFFRVMHLVIDSYENTLPSRVGIVSYCNYTCNFTSLVAGPIQYYRDYVRTESEHPSPLDNLSVGRALDRIATGFFKVSLISPVLLYLHDRYTSALVPGLPLTTRIAYGVAILVVFPTYLYVNFSGYTDFVIGVARFLRLELPENFNKPYLSRSFLDLWTRWHMTLSNWLKTYVYSPLLITLMRRVPSPKLEPWLGVFAYFVTFFLVGAWHGQTTMFLFFGVLQGIGVSLNKLYQIVMTRRLGRIAYRALCANPMYGIGSRGLTYVYFSFTVLWFWSTWGQLGSFLHLLGSAAVTFALVVVGLFGAVVLTALQGLDDWLSTNANPAFGGASYVRTAWCTAMLVLTFSLTVVLNAPAPHIVYKGF